ncbi:acetolactate synthase large subunit (plasmid) [Rhodococcus rhodochrous]|uniref:acetolactate synthase large subunit n=1 Tax=Rhodococcus rhodochrous TaxID=1829 RepID=UPI00132F3396|nr:acetolactate synthase large subunit [Rhodococcus rhodochrous]QHG85524.1 acetolactate synthase large subunit [Rhodococcus rhodochrous]
MNQPTTLVPPASIGGPSEPATEVACTTANSSASPVLVTGAQSVVRSLEALDVEIVFGIPGGAILPVYDPLLDSPQVRHVLVRHEQGAGHAATGYAQATGKVGVCMATSGPGATNLVTALADAQTDSVPVVAITGQVGRPLIGTDAFQEVDICGVTMPITKHNMLVTDPDEIPKALADAFHIASTGRPGVVLVDIPKDILQARTTFSWPPERALPGYRIITRPHHRPIRAAADLIAAAERPVLYVGGGVIKSAAAPELREFVELTGIPVVTTLMARGAFPDSHRLHYGMPGMHGTVAAVAALQRSDLLIALGARFDDRVTGEPTSFAPQAKVIHVDIDPAEIGKNRFVDVPIVGDCKNVLNALMNQIRINSSDAVGSGLVDWYAELDRIRDSFPLGYTCPATGALAPERVIEAIGQAAGPEAIYVAGVGQHQMWAAHFISYDKPRSWLNSGGLGTMGYAVPAALGAKLGAPDREVWAIDGDGCFQMTNQELATAAIEGVPIKVAVINNGNLGMVRQLQHVHYQGRYSNVDLATHTRRIPDFALLAEALGCVALRCDHEADLEATIAQARAVTDRPVVIDFIVDDTALVWPMIAAGASNNHIMLAEGIRPLFDKSD